MRTNASDPRAYDDVVWESWVEAGRMSLYSGWLEKQIINANNELRPLGWKEIKLVYVKERTSWFRRRIFFEMQGQRYAIEFFQEALKNAATAY